MAILLTGANGFLGHSLVPLLLENGFTVLATGKGPNRLSLDDHPRFRYASLDFTDARETEKLINEARPDTIIHAGAMTQVDACEQQQEEARLVNVTGTEYLLQAAASVRAYFIFVSTDFVFNGAKGMYTEQDLPEPVNQYGRTKWEAEERVKKYPFDWAIVRTCLVYGKAVKGRPNILATLQEKAERRETYSVVDDQYRTPTYVKDLATGIIAMVKKRAGGIFHLSGEEMLTPYQMALRTAEYLGLDPALFKRVTADVFSQPALRPPRTGFDLSKARSVLGYRPHSFEDGMASSLKAGS